MQKDLLRHYSAAALGLGAFFGEDLVACTGYGGFVHAGVQAAALAHVLWRPAGWPAWRLFMAVLTGLAALAAWRPWLCGVSQPARPTPSSAAAFKGPSVCFALLPAACGPSPS